MSNRKIDQLPQFSGDTSGIHLVMNNASNTTTYTVTKETLLDGNNTFHGDQVVTGSFNVSGSTTFKGVHNLSGSNTIVGNTLMTGTNTIVGNTTISGSIDVSGSSNFHNSTFIVTGSQYLTGSQFITGSINVSGSLNVNGSIYKNGNKQFNYGQWYSIENQTGSANTAYPMKMEVSVSELSGMYVGNNGSGLPTRIYLQNTGLYNIQFSSQLYTTANQACDFSVWFAMTGSNMANSNTDFTIEKINGGGYMVAALNLLTPISSGSYVELFWSKTTANGQLLAKGTQSAPARPATPSVIVTVTQIA